MLNVPVGCLSVVACGIPCTWKSDLKKYPSLDASLMCNQFRQKALIINDFGRKVMIFAETDYT
tara:strand:+ start:5350 stop:5538 length:189 start_codon:yes stop_codon:yes gene_type:complete